MVINPEVAVQKGWIKNVGENCLQPNSIDVRINKLFRITQGLTIGIDTKSPASWVEEDVYNEEHFFYLDAFTPYQFEGIERINVPKNVCMRLYMRSTLGRQGVFIGASFWDAGFSNYIGAAIYPFRAAQIQKGSRIAQVVFMEAPSCKLYTGQYNKKNDQ